MQNFLSRRSVSLHLQFCTRRYHVIELPIAFLFLLPVLQHYQQVILDLRSETTIPLHHDVGGSLLLGADEADAAANAKMTHIIQPRQRRISEVNLVPQWASCQTANRRLLFHNRSSMIEWRKNRSDNFVAYQIRFFVWKMSSTLLRSREWKIRSILCFGLVLAHNICSGKSN